LAARCRPSAARLAGFSELLQPLPPWPAWDGALGEPAGQAANAVPLDSSGAPREGRNAPGALAFA
jgi:hypothetical protein